MLNKTLIYDTVFCVIFKLTQHPIIVSFSKSDMLSLSVPILASLQNQFA